jgi:DNA (cytosine-5)-methyltransferase 1
VVKYLSVCSGIEAATVAWHHIGWQPVAFSDIEPFPSAVLAHHYPHVPNLGDMTKFEEWNLESVDLLVGGTPCQSFSVAGLRKGLADPRGNLMLTFLAIAQRQRPRWIVWENVPGVLSSNGGRDFGTFLGALGELGYGFAYRVLDAQWFGVAQRRRRVFVVGCLGDWQRPAQVLFERESVRRDTAPSREKGEATTGGTARCFAGSSESTVAATLETTSHDYSRADGFNMVAHYRKSRRAQNVSDFETWVEDDATNTLNCFDIGDIRSTDVVAQPMEYVGGVDYENNAHTMEEPTGPLLKGSPTGGGRPLPAIATAMQVRRLTPVECERLQGFPDGYTNIPWRKKDESPDGPRYKALGNSMAVPVMRWIGERINKVNK